MFHYLNCHIRVSYLFTAVLKPFAVPLVCVVLDVTDTAKGYSLNETEKNGREKGYLISI